MYQDWNKNVVGQSKFDTKETVLENLLPEGKQNNLEQTTDCSLISI